MHFSLVNAMLWLFDLLNFFTIVAAAPTLVDSTPDKTSLDTRQMSGNIYYGDACNPNAPLRTYFPDACWLTVAQTDPLDPHNDPKTSIYESSIFLFDMACNIIGYLPNAGNLEKGWISLDSQLPYTIDIRTVENIPQFNYAGQHYDGNYQNGYVEQWNEGESGNNEHNWRFLVFCGHDKKRDAVPQVEQETPSSISASAPSIMSRQVSNGIYYGNLCNSHDVYATRYPQKCWLTFYQKKSPGWSQSGPPTTFIWDTTLYIFRTNCDIIGYIPDAADLEGRWVSMDSQLKYTVDVTTFNNVPHFNYAGTTYDGDSSNAYSVNWTENDSGIDVTVWKVLFNC